jgi:site-specific recombinase XerC
LRWYGASPGGSKYRSPQWNIGCLVFASAVGTPLDRHNVLREFRKITQAAGLGTDWVPREMRHTFVSLLSFNGTALEDIADLVGHRGTATTETVYRDQAERELRKLGRRIHRQTRPGTTGGSGIEWPRSGRRLARFPCSPPSLGAFQ